MNAVSIGNQIDVIVAGDYQKWYIGVTDDPDGQKREHGNPAVWHQWQPDNKSESRVIEKHFIYLQMDGGPMGRGNAEFVYIYKK